MIPIPILRQLWPHGDSKIPGLIEGISDASVTVFAKYGLTNDLLVAHAMAQFSHECGAGTEMVENIRYSAERAVAVWPRRFTSAQDCYQKVGSYAGDPQFPTKLMDNVYGSRMGNRPGTHDGSIFIGRGLSQCTGRENYDKLGKKTGLDLLSHPEFLSDPFHALECGVADFIMCGCLTPATLDDVRGVTLRLNGGYIGLEERTQWLSKWKAALGAPHASTPPSAAPVAAPTSFWSKWFKRT
jgi:putative chitinase